MKPSRCLCCGTDDLVPAEDWVRSPDGGRQLWWLCKDCAERGAGIVWENKVPVRVTLPVSRG